MASLDPIFGMGRRNDADATRALKDMVRRRFGLGEADSVFVAEVACGETDCPDVETVIAIFPGGHRHEFKLAKAVKAIAEEDLNGLADP